VADALLTGGALREPGRSEGAQSLAQVARDAASLYGEMLGVRCMRKHFASFVDWAEADPETARAWRGRLCRAASLEAALDALDAFAAGARLKDAA